MGQLKFEPQDQVKGGFFLDVIVVQSTPILKLLSCENQALLIRGDAVKKIKG